MLHHKNENELYRSQKEKAGKIQPVRIHFKENERVDEALIRIKIIS
jgi:hypothetical protein